MCDKQLNFSSSNINSSLNDISQIIQNFDKINIKELEPTTKNVNKNIFDGDLNIIIDELINFILDGLNEGKDEEVVKHHVLNYVNKHKLMIHEFYYWLLNNQNNSNSIYLLGYFNYHGIVTNINKKKAIELYQKAAKLENCVAQLILASMYIYGNGIDKNYDLAFELSKKLAEKGIPNAINKLGYCYNNKIGTEINEQKAFELYKKAADLGNSTGISNLGWCYDKGIGTATNKSKAFELYQKAADLGNSFGINNLGAYYKYGVVTDVDEQKAFELYQKAANLGNHLAQYNLALKKHYFHQTN
ncbi:kinase-like domain-containing protein [Rhizophagus clarus]|uniref:Kinase-like domain-containing protein n=1 Tax=Rhizophagus clarus TaxID=94130 RepID=A0A8H3LLS5_9GLOM|nr:kinase-like domain-containing protein [Rhizophagus clarus]